MKAEIKEKAINFLRNKGILKKDKTEFVISGLDTTLGYESVNNLLIEFAESLEQPTDKRGESECTTCHQYPINCECKEPSRIEQEKKMGEFYDPEKVSDAINTKSVEEQPKESEVQDIIWNILFDVRNETSCDNLSGIANKIIEVCKVFINPPSNSIEIDEIMKDLWNSNKLAIDFENAKMLLLQSFTNTKSVSDSDLLSKANELIVFASNNNYPEGFIDELVWMRDNLKQKEK